MSDAHLIQLAQAGDAGAWEALTRLHQEPVFRYAYLLLGDADDAQDVTQQTFVRAFYSIQRFNSDLPVRPWLLSIVSRLSHNWRRSAARYLQALVRFGSEPHVGEAEGIDAADAAQLRAAVQTLRPAFQQVIYLRFFLGLSEDATAQAAGVPPGTIKSRLHRALRALREVVARDYPHLMESVAE